MGQQSGVAVGVGAMHMQPREISEHGGRFGNHQFEELGQTHAVVFVLVVDGVAQFTDQLPVIGRIDDLQSLHEGEYGAEAIHVLFFFDGY